MAKRTTKRASKKEYTLAEFKAWLEGIEELQPNNWAPDAGQWKVIRDKLMNIIEEEPAPVEVVNNPIPAGPIPRNSAMPMPAMPATPPPAVSSLPPVGMPEPNLTPAAQAALSGKLPTEMMPSADGKVKTPDIDTADGNYGSSFE
jgi:hypothetical protein